MSFAAMLLLLSGCASTEQRPGVTKESGFYTRIMPASPQRIGIAAQQALKGMDLMLMQSAAVRDGWTVVGRNFQDTRVTVSITPDGENVSKVGVKVDPGESEGLSLRVLDQIQQQLHG